MSRALSNDLDRSPSTLASALKEDLIKGEVLCDAFTRSMYSTDASIYEIEPLVVVYPVDEMDVRNTLWFGAKHGVPVIARGAGSGLAGESLGKAIIMDMSIHMNRIIELDKKNRTVTVEPGVVLDSLNRALAQHGFRFGPDPASGNRCTLGGMIANNASGARSLKYGDTRNNLLAVRLCLMDGTVTLANPVKMSSEDYENKKKEESLAGKIHRELPELIKANAALIASKKPKVERNRSGYLLHDVINGDVYDLPKLICGSEGTLGVVTQAVLRVEPLPGRVGLAVVYFASVVDAAKAVPAIRETQPIACELLDENVINAASTQHGTGRQDACATLPEGVKAMLAVEYEGLDLAEVTTKLKALEAKLPAGTYKSIRLIDDGQEQVDLWALRTAATPLLYKRTDGLQPVAIVEDGAVPPEKLATYLEKCAAIFAKYKLEWSAYAHAGSGEVHLRPMMDLRTKAHVDIIEKVAGEVHAAVWELGGTISGEHADGLVRSQWVEKQAGKELYAVFKSVKELFDPTGLLNPNKKITTDAHLMLKNLRLGPTFTFSTGERPKPKSIDATQAANYRMFKSQLAIRTENTVEAYANNPLDVHMHGRSPLNWAGEELANEAIRCNGCGHCRTTGREEDMCPRFKYERIEDASPRAKANVVRRMMSGRQGQGAFSSDELIEIMDTCFNCKLCHDDCPSNVNIPKIVQEAKARHYQSHGLPMEKWILTRSEAILKAGSLLAPLYNTLINLMPVRFIAEKIIKIDRRRKLPNIRFWKMRHRFVFAGASAPSARLRVVLYVDTFARYHTPELIQSAVDVLEHNGIEVHIPDAPGTNAHAVSEGAVQQARATAGAISKILAPFAFQGMPILTLDSTSALCLREEFLSYLDTPETRAVSRHTREIGEYLFELYREKKLKMTFNKTEMTVGYHQPCHHKALHIGMPGYELIKKIPGVKVIHINEGCCGNPTGWGLAKKNYDESMWIGKNIFRDLADPARHIQLGITESACCKMQLEHGSTKPTLHPVQIMALAYGFTEAVPRDDGRESFEVIAPPVVHEEHAPVKEESHAAPAHDHGHAEAHH